MIQLNLEQQDAVDQDSNLVVTACPGSGKTRVLTYRTIRALQTLESTKHRVVALTFTNRATDEIQTRLDQADISHDQLWAGTIHAFALEWILRPYAPYIPRIQRGFSVADEFFTERTLSKLKSDFGQRSFYDVNTARDRDGNVENEEVAAEIFLAYQSCLQEAKLLDYDDVLYYAYRLLQEVEEIPRTLGHIIRLICVDEIQDTQDLQFGILSSIYSAADEPPVLFFVGDAGQSIYESLGAVSKSPDQIAQEFGLSSIPHMELTGNYRSTQRLIDYYRQFRPNTPPIQSLTEHAADPGIITFHNQTVTRDDLPATVAQLIRDSIEAGIPTREICVLAPHWWHVRALGRSLVQQLPEVDFDAPGLSPLRSQRENLWFKISRLFLTTPMPSLYRTRFRWVREVLRDLGEVEGVAIPDAYGNPRAFLRLVNSTESTAHDGLDYLEEVFAGLAEALGIEIDAHNRLSEAKDMFFQKARERIADIGEDAPTETENFRKLFRHPSGVIISTCHGVKGEEYETVIAFGLLRGYIPNWQAIIHGAPGIADDWASKLFYVICSRAKRRLHLIAESGRFTQTGNEYETATLLRSINFDYDPAL
jgi:superfamily I DNA/RNA helicase